MNKGVILSICLVPIIINGLIGHFFAPWGILLTPAVMLATTGPVAFLTKGIKPVLKSVMAAIFVSLNDISIKLYAGGTHDNEGQGWLTLMFFVGVLPAFATLIAGIFFEKETSLFQKITAIVVFPALIAIHLYLFGNLGLERQY